MSIHTHQSMINHHDSSVWAQVGDTFHVWRERQRQRWELAQWSARDLHDAGISRSDAAHETEKPFWRA